MLHLRTKGTVYQDWIVDTDDPEEAQEMVLDEDSNCILQDLIYEEDKIVVDMKHVNVVPIAVVPIEGGN